MLKKRIIPILLIKNGSIVKTVKFQNPRIVGDVRSTVQIFKNRLADELCIVDIDMSILFACQETENQILPGQSF